MELKVKVTGDTAGFKRALTESEREAEVFARNVERKAAARQGRGIAGVATRAGGLAGAAGSLSGIPGMSQVGTAAAATSNAAFGAGEIAAALGVGMGVAASAVAVFAGSIAAVTIAINKYKEMVKAQAEELVTRARADKEEADMRKAYIKVVKDAYNAGKLSFGETAELIGGVNDPKRRRDTMREIADRFGGAKTTESLSGMLKASRIAGMEPGKEKAMAEEAVRFEAAMKKATEALGDWSTASEESKDKWRELNDAQLAEHQRRVSEIDKQFQEKLNPSKPTVDSLAKVGLFTASGLNAIAQQDIQRQMLQTQKQIARNTDPNNQPDTDPFS